MGNIGMAVEALRSGAKVTRSEGWHGKHFLVYVTPNPYTVVDNDGDLYGAQDPKNPNHVQPLRGLRPFVGIVPANDANNVTPWLCSQSDLLAEDWELYSLANTPRKQDAEDGDRPPRGLHAQD